MITPNDIIYIAPGEKHWHGADPHHAMTHIAINIGGDVEWLEEVDEATYKMDFR